jgi:aspartate aminotransferase
MSKVDLASRLATLNESATLALNARAKQLAAEGKTVYNLTAGELASGTPDYIRSAVAKSLGMNKYTPAAGLPELRDKIAAHARSFYGLDWIKAENVVVTGGAKPALFAVFLSLINPGDEVIVPVPAWVSYIDLIQLVGGVVVEAPLVDTYDLDVETIKAKISPKTKAILINSPHNPTGAVFSKKTIEKLAAALKGSGITLISDDIYTKLVFEDEFMLVPKAGFDNLIIVNGFSKSQALTGWRIGYLIADKAVADAATALLSHINGNAALPSQYAAVEAMTRDDMPPAGTLDDLRRKKQIVVKALSKVPGLKVNNPGGAFYIFLDLRGLTDNSAQWCEQLLVEAGVALVPGEAFAAPGFARLTFVGDDEVLERAVEQIKLLVKQGSKSSA